MKLLSWFLKKYNRQSPIVFLLTGMLGVSALLIPVFGLMKALKDDDPKKFELNFEKMCSLDK